MKKMLSMLIILLISGLLISCDSKKNIPPPQPPSELDKLKKAAALLSRFGSRIATADHIPPDDAKIITALAAMNYPIAAFINRHSTMVSGIDFSTKENVVLSSTTGSSISPCDKSEIISKRGNRCKTQAIAPNDAVAAALNITQPIKGKILVEGVEKDAEYFISVEILYEGSHCVTRYSNGVEYEDCSSFPFP